jgi:hypothetical protein
MIAIDGDVASGRGRKFAMAIDDIPIIYKITFEKDHASVKVTYSLKVPVGGPTLISDFQATVDGTDLISGFLPGQTEFTGVKFHNLASPGKDATVSYTMSSSLGWSAGEEDVLRGEKTYDEVYFPTSAAATSN